MNRKSGDSTRKTAQGEINPPLHELVQFRREFNSMSGLWELHNAQPPGNIRNPIMTGRGLIDK